MKTKMMFAVSFVTAMVLLSGCGGGEQAKTGFLSDYSKLQKESDSGLRYVNSQAAQKYSLFIVDPVQIRFTPKAKSEGKLTDQQIMDLTNYMHTKVVEAINGAGLKVVYHPAQGVARIRIALTDIEKTGAINMIPQASLLGAGVGGASMEAEIVDSMTGEQIGAIVQSKQGSRMPFSNLGDWTAAKSVMDAWADRFQKRLEESR
jgi:hypothetical protein